MANSSKLKRPSKSAKRKLYVPAKPYDGFPMGPSSNGYWQKRIRGELCRFGRWGDVKDGKLVERPNGGDWESALRLYNAQKDDLHAGRLPEEITGELTVTDLCNAFLTSKIRKQKSNELSQRTLNELRQTTDRIIAQFGAKRIVKNLKPSDFELLRADIAKTCGPVRLANEIQRVRSVFKYADDNDLIDRPVKYGSEFKRPSKRIMRNHKNSRAKRFFEADEIKTLLDSASPQMRCMILLGINLAYGNSDIANLEMSKINLETGWATYPRGKTGIARRCALWPETQEALQQVIDNRPEPKSVDDTDIIFITKYGRRWVRSPGKDTAPVDSVGLEFGKLLGELGMKKSGRAFYSLRHTHRTVSAGAGDPTAARIVMGHVSDSIDDVYVERVEDSRLQAISEHVRQWLFGTDDGGNREPQEVRANTPSLVTTSPAVTVEYDQDGMRAQKHFDSSHAAKRFYVKMDVEGKNPSAIVEDNTPQLRVFG
jgi:integrase